VYSCLLLVRFDTALRDCLNCKLSYILVVQEDTFIKLLQTIVVMSDN
jgi:hypothetical protein